MRWTPRWLVAGAVALAVMAMGCGSKSRLNPVGVDRGSLTPAAEADLQLHVGETLPLSDPNATVTFDRLFESRCPRGVVCAVAGIATVNLTVRSGEKSASIEITLMGEEGVPGALWSPTVEALGHTFSMKRLDPYPVYLEPVPDTDRVLTLIVS